MGFFHNKKVMVTGHTGFKGSWLCHILANAGANVVGYSLPAPTNPNLFSLAHIEDRIISITADIRDFDALSAAISRHEPQIIIHLAAQPLVLDAYRVPHYTYETNVMGTVNLLEAIRTVDCVRSLVNVTTDKVYLNNERSDYGYVEDDSLDGYDPYSNSKSCSDLITHSYARSFLLSRGVAVSTARAGNVIGGGDFSANRILPDCVRAAVAGQSLMLRSPFSVRPYQHVLESLFAYLLIAARQFSDIDLSSAYNVGPDDNDCVNTRTLVGLFADSWQSGFAWIEHEPTGEEHHEATYLKLDATRLKQTFGWKPRWHIAQAVAAMVWWTQVYVEQGDIKACMDAQIREYLEG